MTVKLDSNIFDSIRVKPDQDRLRRDSNPPCEWQGCADAGTHRAPKGRGHDGEYHLFCMNHVREYNKSYNYFAGMSDKDVGKYQKAALTGHRPTWSLGSNPYAGRQSGKGAGKSHSPETAEDPFGLFGDDGHPEKKQRRPIRNAERKALTALSLDETADPAGIKAQYKMLVKRHHPDANGGGRDAEEKLREIIQAYDYLKRAGFC